MGKVEKETHLMYSRHSYSADAVTVAEQDRFLSGSQDGLLQLWSPSSKKPVATASLGSSCWITALKAIRRSNVVFSGCATGKLRCWRYGRQTEEDSEDASKGVQLTEALPCRAARLRQRHRGRPEGACLRSRQGAPAGSVELRQVQEEWTHVVPALLP